MPKKAASAAAAPAAAPASSAAQLMDPNNIYSIDYVNDDIVITEGARTIHRIPLAQLRRINGTTFRSKNELIVEQQKWNYLDSIKDKIDSILLQSLAIYPESGNPEFTSLHKWENAILAQVNSNLTRRTWTKLYHMQEKEKIDVGRYLWESGIGREHFIAETANTTTTFGSFIDPLSKPGQIWPPVGYAVHIMEPFMEALGFNLSSIFARTTGDDNTSNADRFSYVMKIACGTYCSGDRCILQDYNDDDVYMGGNKKKEAFLKQSGRAREKTIFTVMKEWGDKTQVIFYLILYFVMKAQRIQVLMSTCDLVVFILCIILGIRCVFTGKFDRPIDFPTKVLKAGNGSYYSIVDYYPGTPFENEYTRLEQKIVRTMEENAKIIASMQHLRQHSDISIGVQGTSGTTFPPEFYERIVLDMTAINAKLQTDFGSIKTARDSRIAAYGAAAFAANIDTELNSLKEDSKRIDDEFLLVPIIKKKGVNLCMTLGSSYTLNNINRTKPNFKNINGQLRDTDTFYNIGRLMARSVRSGGGQKGGARAPGGDDLLLFHESHHEPILHTDKKHIKLKHPKNASANANESESASASDRMNESESENEETIDLQAKLDESFTQSFKLIYGGPADDYVYHSLYETLYTLYIYEAERDGMASIDITPVMILELCKRHEISIPQPIVVPATSISEYMKPFSWFGNKPVPSVRSDKNRVHYEYVKKQGFFNTRKIKQGLNPSKVQHARQQFIINQRRTQRNKAVNIKRNPTIRKKLRKSQSPVFTEQLVSRDFPRYHKYVPGASSAAKSHIAYPRATPSAWSPYWSGGKTKRAKRIRRTKKNRR